MNVKVLGVHGLVVVVAFAVGVLAGYFFGNRLNRIRYGAELESIRAEQLRTNEQYQQLRANYNRERELNNRIRAIITGSTELLQSNDLTISGLKGQLSSLREKIQELKAIFDNFTASSVANRSGGDVARNALD
jgi:DNA repair exonuclease SbcCD ATPase subunit